ncbi:hypothetical protein QWZ13_10530 [Reinekea marina]|uniref:hypothetical protein n=1 Tax=Reinekea marina TaxID=1310421 RepID=UPI0025B2CBF6|nr:hypothetical protein [Reinekea marina]MDN3649346.1 hypothetical protein [Reinekea marina]
MNGNLSHGWRSLAALGCANSDHSNYYHRTDVKKFTDCLNRRDALLVFNTINKATTEVRVVIVI